MSPLWTSSAADAATGGKSTAQWTARGVSIDSRTVEPDDLFVALEGPNHDGHDYVTAALRRGASAAMVRNVPEDARTLGPLLRVPDTLDGLYALAATARQRSSARIAAVTGSVGKTGVKEALRLVLEQQAPTQANLGNLNNHWGAPLSLARLEQSTRFGIFELGMNHAGEIAPLSRLVQPHVAIITTIAPAHTAHFASVEEIANAKAEIFEGVMPSGTAVLNRDSPFYEHLSTAARRCGIERVISFGQHGQADVRLLSISLLPNRSDVEAHIDGRRITFAIGAPGSHWSINSLAVLAAVSALGADVETAAASLADVKAPQGRGRQMIVPLRDGSFTLIDESYNASPAAVRAALETLSLSEAAPNGRRIAILGDMLELGPDAPTLHSDLAEAVERRGVDLVYAAGPAMADLYRALAPRIRGHHAVSTEALLPVIEGVVRPGDVVLVKGSLGMQMARVVRALMPDGSKSKG